MINDPEKHLIVVVNKCDTDSGDLQTNLASGINLKKNDTLLFISAKEKSGVEDLRNRLSEISMKRLLSSDDIIITNIRHYNSLIKVSESLERVISGLMDQVPEDLIAIDIRQAIHYLGEITGEITSDEILGNIFRNFCIGK
jgi:tRNA modification GTPase